MEVISELHHSHSKFLKASTWHHWVWRHFLKTPLRISSQFLFKDNATKRKPNSAWKFSKLALKVKDSTWKPRSSQNDFKMLLFGHFPVGFSHGSTFSPETQWLPFVWELFALKSSSALPLISFVLHSFSWGLRWRIKARIKEPPTHAWFKWDWLQCFKR